MNRKEAERLSDRYIDINFGYSPTHPAKRKKLTNLLLRIYKKGVKDGKPKENKLHWENGVLAVTHLTKWRKKS